MNKIFSPFNFDEDLQKKENSARDHLTMQCAIALGCGIGCPAALLIVRDYSTMLIAAGVIILLGILSIILAIVNYRNVIHCCTVERLSRKKGDKLREYSARLLKMCGKIE